MKTAKEITKDFSMAYKRQMKRNALWPSDVHRILKISYALLNSYRCGTGFPRKETMYALAELFDCSIDELYGRKL